MSIERGDRVTIDGHPGIAWVYDGPQIETGWEWKEFTDADGDVFEYEEEYERETGQHEFHMVGDDQTWLFELEDAAPISEEDYCSECGQIGCGWG